MYHIKVSKRTEMHGAVVTHVSSELVRIEASFHVKSCPGVTHILFAHTKETTEVAEDVRAFYSQHADVIEIKEGAAIVAARSIENSWHAYIKAMSEPEFA